MREHSGKNVEKGKVCHEVAGRIPAMGHLPGAGRWRKWWAAKLECIWPLVRLAALILGLAD